MFYFGFNFRSACSSGFFFLDAIFDFGCGVLKEFHILRFFSLVCLWVRFREFALGAGFMRPGVQQGNMLVVSFVHEIRSRAWVKVLWPAKVQSITPWDIDFRPVDFPLEIRFYRLWLFKWIPDIFLAIRCIKSGFLSISVIFEVQLNVFLVSRESLNKLLIKLSWYFRLFWLFMLYFPEIINGSWHPRKTLTIILALLYFLSELNQSWVGTNYLQGYFSILTLYLSFVVNAVQGKSLAPLQGNITFRKCDTAWGVGPNWWWLYFHKLGFILILVIETNLWTYNPSKFIVKDRNY